MDIKKAVDPQLNSVGPKLYPQDIEILGWCPAGSVLPHRENVPLHPWLATLVGHPSCDGVTIKIPYGVDVSFQPPALHPIFSNWVG